MAEAVSMLPASGTTAWERAVDLTSAERHPWPVGVIRDVWDPQKCPEHLLPYLAACLSVDIWNPNWPIETKRSVVAQSIELHRLKGTLEGIRRHLKLVGVEVVDVILPPQGIIAEPAQTAEQRRAAMAGLADLRVYVNRQRFAGHGAEFVSSGALVDAVIAEPADPSRLARRAEIVEGDVVTEVKWGQVPELAGPDAAIPVERITIPGRGNARTGIADMFLPDWSVVDDERQSRILTIGIDRAAVVAGPRQLSPSIDGLDVVSVTPERVAERKPWDGASFMVGGLLGTVDDAELDIYDRWYIADRSASGQRRAEVPSFLPDYSRISWPDYTAMFRLRRTFTGSFRSATVDGFLPDYVFVEPASDPWSDIHAAFDASQALRDAIKFTTATKRPRTFADGYPLTDGGFAFGDMVAF